MVVVLSTPLVAMLKKTALEIPGVYEIKTNRQNCFLYCDNDKTSEENVAMIKNYIKEKSLRDLQWKSGSDSRQQDARRKDERFIFYFW